MITGAHTAFRLNARPDDQGDYIQVAFFQDTKELDHLDTLDVEDQAAYMAQWDYGTENDDAAAINGERYADIPAFAHTRETEAHYDGIDYIVQEDLAAAYYALYRRAID